MICGSRNLNKVINCSTYEKVSNILEKELEIKEISLVIHGGAKGVDTSVEEWCNKHNIKTQKFRPDQEKYNNYKLALLKRNDEMISKADKVLAIWDGSSNGTKYVIENTKESNIKVFNLGTNLSDF